jgi:hypothetical protein
MDGSLSNWFQGQPVVLETGNTALTYWYNGQPYSFLEPEAAGGSSSIKTAYGLALADIKTAIGLAKADVKSMIGISNV